MQHRDNINQVTSFNDQWSLDFVSDRLTDGRTIRFLNIIDSYSRFNTGIEVGCSLPSSKVIEILTTAINKYGKPKSFCLDNVLTLESISFLNKIIIFAQNEQFKNIAKS